MFKSRRQGHNKESPIPIEDDSDHQTDELSLRKRRCKKKMEFPY